MFQSGSIRVSIATTLFALLSMGGCAPEAGVDPNDLVGDELGAGELLPEDGKFDMVADSAATQCKPIPSMPTLAQPAIYISVEGLTLRLVDNATGFEKIFPIGPGAIDTDPESITFGESLSMYPPLAYGTKKFKITRSSRTPCAIWHTETKLPLFAGLPFMSWSGAYGIHGPIDNYGAPNGGNLRQGFVSHGCIRMEAADILEVYARTLAANEIPVYVQREPERRADGSRIDLTSKWIGSECRADADCNFAGGKCITNTIGERGFCSLACTTSCPDRKGQPTTFCVRDEQNPSRGLCMPQAVSQSSDCRAFDHFVPETAMRPTPSQRTALTCVPGTRGGIGDHCATNDDCHSQLCANSVCTTPCSGLCADEPGYAITTCINGYLENGGAGCARTCTGASNASECPGDTACVQRTRYNGAKRFVCEPIAQSFQAN